MFTALTHYGKFKLAAGSNDIQKQKKKSEYHGMETKPDQCGSVYNSIKGLKQWKEGEGFTP